MVKLGRPRKRKSTKKQEKLREQWRDSSARYYKKNRKKILGDAKQKPKKVRKK